MPRAPRQQRAIATVDAIIESGFISLASHGLAGTTTRHIADIAGIGVGSLYEYFENKEAIYAAMHDRFVADLVAMLQPLNAIIVKQDIHGAVTTIIGRLQEFLSEHDARYLRYAQSAMNLEMKIGLEPVTRVLQELVMNYVMHHPELMRMRRLATMSHIFINGSIFVMLRHLADPSPLFSIDELVQGLSEMLSHYVAMELQLTAMPAAAL
ncbi:MAG: TetR/AcrR family transcriptional regulator [Pseudomonadota bacterium]